MRQFARKIRQAANLFRRLGVGPGDSVALLMPHVPAGQIALWGAEIAGRACPINPMLRPEHIVALLTAAEAKVAVVLGENRDMDIWNAVVPSLREAKCLSHILHADADGPTNNSDGCFEALIARENADRLDFAAPATPDAIAACFHTGGTTGAPKLALHTHRNQAFVARGAAAMYDLGPDDVLINGFPLFHVAGAFVYGLSVLSAGGTTPDSDPARNAQPKFCRLDLEACGGASRHRDRRACRRSSARSMRLRSMPTSPRCGSC